jgi:hypothetical protein
VLIGTGAATVKDLYETEEACRAACAQQDADHREYMERHQWNKGKHGRTEAARHVRWHRVELERARRDVAYHERRIAELR